MPKGGKHKGKGNLQKRKSSQPPSTQPRRKQPPRGVKFRNNNSGGWRWRGRGGGGGGNAAKIEEYMTSHGVVRKSIVGDGNCLFRAMADQIGYGEDRHREIREKIVETIKADKEYFANFIDEEEAGGVDEYCNEMIKDGVWGDDIELEAFRRAFKRPLVIYDASTGTPYVKPFDGDEGKGLDTVHLWKSECHYESVRNKDGPWDGPSRVVYRDVKMSQEEVEKLKRNYEEAVEKELRGALPTIHIREIRRLVKEFDGDGNKVLEFLSGVVTNEESQEPAEDQPTTLPNGDSQPIELPTESPTDPQQDELSLSMEILSLNPDPPTVVPPVEESPPKEDSPDPSFQMEEQDDPKEKARQRRHVSAARKNRLAKKEQKEAAKRRKHIEALGMEKMDDTISTAAQENVLKAIVI